MTTNISQFVGGDFSDDIFDQALFDQSGDSSGELTVSDATATRFVLTNTSNGRTTIITGAGFTFSAGQPTGGVIAGLEFKSGASTLGTMTGLALGATAFLDAVDASGAGNDVPLETLLGADAYAFDGSTATRTNFNGFFTGVQVGGFGGADTFVGSRFNDRFETSGGADVYNGGSGTDAVDYSQGAGLGTRAIVANLATGVALNTVGLRDTLRSIEQVIGTERSDTFFGGDAAARFFGFGGNDAFRMGTGGGFISPGAGKDIVLGSTGFDIVDYSAATGRRVTINLRDGAALDPWGFIDTLTSVDQARGSSGVDLFLGSAGADQFAGRDGADVFNGLGGRDWVRYDLDGGPGGVSVDLAAGTATDSFGATDTLLTMENLIGTAQNDGLAGDAGANLFAGGDGVDAFDGRGGFDTVDFSFEEDQLGGSARVIVNLNTGKALDSFGNLETITGIEFVIGASLADVMVGGAGADRFEGRGGGGRFDGGAGVDTVSFASDPLTRGAIVNMLTGKVLDTTGVLGAIANVERIDGSAFGDWVVAGASGMFFSGGDGADRFDGGAGVDTLIYGDPDATRGIVINLGTGQAVGDFGDRDVFSSVERVIGGAFADVMAGAAANETFAGLGGADDIRGGLGTDTVDYSRDATAGGRAGVSVNLAAGTATDGFGAADKLSAIENVIGTTVADAFNGSSGNNRFFSSAGADAYNGAGGFDFVDFSGEAARVVVNLGSGAATDGTGSADALAAIEGVVGSAFDDILVGSDLVDRLEGGAGADALRGNGGNDVMFGGAGEDVFQYLAADWGADLIVDWQDGLDRIVVDGVTGLATLTDFVVTQSGTSARLAFGASAIVLANTDIATLDASDFVFV